MKQTLMIGTLVVALAGCAGVVRNDEYTQLVVQAENEIKLADKTGFLWRDTEKFLKESKEAKAAADKATDRATKLKEFDKAMKLAQKALKQAQLAQQQARDNVNPVAKYQ
jgi:malic enzyme